MMEALLGRTVLGERLSQVGGERLSETHVAWLSAVTALHDVGMLSGAGADRAFAGMVNVLTGRVENRRLRQRLARWLGSDVTTPWPSCGR